jgi:hypothetical protein
MRNWNQIEYVAVKDIIYVCNIAAFTLVCLFLWNEQDMFVRKYSCKDIMYVCYIGCFCSSKCLFCGMNKIYFCALV